MNRGGVAVLFRNYLWASVYDVSRSKDQVWFSIKTLHNTKIGAVYITPRDSPFFYVGSFAKIHEIVKVSNGNVLVLGDFNARIGDLNALVFEADRIQYSSNVDTATNTNGRDLVNLCLTSDLKPLNHMMYHGKSFDGNLTFKQKDRWISQLDWAVASKDLLCDVLSFKILQSQSLPTNHAALALHLRSSRLSAAALLDRATQLGSSVQGNDESGTKPVRIQNVDKSKFIREMPNPDDLWSLSQEPDILCNAVSDLLYNTAKSCKVKYRSSSHASFVEAPDRWQRIIDNKDSKQLWQSINWKGEFASPTDESMLPAGDVFCRFYEDLLSSPEDVASEFVPSLQKFVPVLDSPVTPNEVDHCIRKLKANKAAGVDGVAPGLLKLLNDEWVLFITYIFNVVFSSRYPLFWAVAKVFNIFKKGDNMNPSNYRGISIMVAMAKLFDAVLSERFNLWFKPRYVQAGGQSGRGCAEQILTLRLLNDIARKEKRPSMLPLSIIKKLMIA